MKYYLYKDTFIFSDNGYSCLLSDNDRIFEVDNQRGDGIKTDYNIDLLTGDINLIRVFFKETYCSNTEIIKKVGEVKEVKEVSEEQAKEILKNNKRTVGYLLTKELIIGSM